MSNRESIKLFVDTYIAGVLIYIERPFHIICMNLLQITGVFLLKFSKTVTRPLGSAHDFHDVIVRT